MTAEPASAAGAIVVTGAGVIGGLTARLLAARGERTVLLDIAPPREPPPAGIEVVRCDIADAAALETALRAHRVRAIVHTAAMLSTGIRRDPLRGVAVNALGTAHVLDCARRLAIGRVVLASSTTVGYAAFPGASGPAIDEDFAMRVVSQRPASIYAATKLFGEHLALLHADLYGVDVVVLRYGAVLGGPLDTPTSVPGRLLARLAEGARTGARVVLDDPYLVWGGIEEFVDARDCARANLHALDAAAPVRRVYNVATGRAVTLGEFVEAARRALGPLEVAFGPEPATGFAGFPHRRPAPSATEAARAELGFACRHDLEDSIRFWAGRETDGAGAPRGP